MMGSRSLKGILLAGIVGAAAGMYIMHMLDDTPAERQLTNSSRRMMRSAQRGVSRLGTMYDTSKNVVRSGMNVLLH